MKKRINIIILAILSLFLINSSLYADENRIFNLKIINHSNSTFIIKSILTAPGVTIKPNKELLEPQGEMLVKCENVASNGINGRIHFVDDNRNLTQLFLEVREQRHYGQPVYKMDNQFYNSRVIEQHRNKNIGGRFLTYTDAAITINDN